MKSENDARKYPHISYTRLPEHMRRGAYLYIEHGIAPGSFLTAVICNDLFEACGRADDVNRYRLVDIVSWFYNEAPAMSWGNAAKMAAWIQSANAEHSAGPQDNAVSK